ncbi:MAG: hypothetical protein IIC00_15545 [Planctomycetes bacterium]|nr:hypothetical protein [Planctomycetota bacterium]
MVHGRLEVSGHPLLGFIANAITDSQAEMRITVARLDVKCLCVSVDGVVDSGESSPQH